MMMRVSALFLFALVFLTALPIWAQEAPVDPAAAIAATGGDAVGPDTPAAEGAADAAAAQSQPVSAPVATVKTPFRDTLLFSGAEIAALREAAAGRRSNEAFLDAEKTELIPIDRKIRLSGIYYKDDGNWIVWLNGYKLHPRYLLKEIHRIDVKRDEIFLSWYDIGLNDVINIRMRPHQVYDIVTGILYNDTAGGYR